MLKIIADFLEFNLSSINKKLKCFRNCHIKEKKPLMMKVGGVGGSSLVNRHKDCFSKSELLFTLPTGTGVYRSKNQDMWGSNICFGDPHKKFTQALRRIGGNHMQMTAFVNT